MVMVVVLVQLGGGAGCASTASRPAPSLASFTSNPRPLRSEVTRNISNHRRKLEEVNADHPLFSFPPLPPLSTATALSFHHIILSRSGVTA